MIASDPNRAKATASTSTLVIMPAALSHRNTLGLSQSEEACLELLIGISMRVGSPVFDFNQMDTACSDWEEGYQSLNRFKSACDLEFGALGAVKSVNGRWLVPSLCLMVIGAIGIFANGASNIAMALCLGVPFICIGVFCMAAADRKASPNAASSMPANAWDSNAIWRISPISPIAEPLI